MTSVARKRIKTVFDNSLKNVSNGKSPNVSTEMAKAGYSPSSCRALKVTQSRTWKDLLNRIDDEMVIAMLQEIVKEKEDKRARIAAGVELLKLKDRYPQQKSKAVGLFEILNGLE